MLLPTVQHISLFDLRTEKVAFEQHQASISLLSRLFCFASVPRLKHLKIRGTLFAEEVFFFVVVSLRERVELASQSDFFLFFLFFTL